MKDTHGVHLSLQDMKMGIGSLVPASPRLPIFLSYFPLPSLNLDKFVLNLTLLQRIHKGYGMSG